MKLLHKATGLTVALIAMVAVFAATGPAESDSAGMENHASASSYTAPDPGWD